MRIPFCKMTASGALACSVLALSGCATGEADREMIPVERVVSYKETADVGHGSVVLGSVAGAKNPFARKCRKYREHVQTERTVFGVAATVGLLGNILGLLSKDKTAQTIAGLAGVGASLTEAGAATAEEITTNNAEEKGCWIPQ